MKTITKDWLKEYQTYLQKEGKSFTTVGMHMRAIRAILNAARAKGIIKAMNYPLEKADLISQPGKGGKWRLQ